MSGHVTDFGIAKWMGATSIESLTSTVALKGSAGYIAPGMAFQNVNFTCLFPNIPQFMFTEKCCGNINILVFMWIYVKNLWGHYMHSSTGSQKNVCMKNIWIHYPHSGTNTSWKRGPTCGYMVEQRLLIMLSYISNDYLMLVKVIIMISYISND